jgi:hypothetical protein
VKGCPGTRKPPPPSDLSALEPARRRKTKSESAVSPNQMKSTETT